jgi:hypothetical protein
MITRLVLLGLGVSVLLLAACAVVAQEDKPLWPKFTPKGETFSVRMPKRPTVRTAKVVVGDKTVEQKVYVLAVTPGVFVLTFNDDPTLGKADKEKVEAALASARDKAVKVMKGKLLSDKAVKLGTNLGRDFQIQTERSGVSRSRIYVVGQRLYQLTVAGPKDWVTSEMADYYLGSLTVDK